jgi:hypothetical protein
MARAPTFQAKQGTFKERVKNLGGEVDFFGAKWAKAMDGFLEGVQAYGADVLSVFKALVGELFTLIVLRTPKNTGHAQSGWQLKPKTDTPDDYQVLILNIVSYIVFLEFGWSKQAPKGMVRISMEEMRVKLVQALAKMAA